MANRAIVGYVDGMSRSRARRWTVMFGFVIAGCGGDAAALRKPVAPVAETGTPVAPAAITASAAQPTSGVEPLTATVPAATAPAAPGGTTAVSEPVVPPAPAVVLPPCPSDARDKEQLPDHVVQLVGLSEAMTVVDLGSGSGYFLCRLSRAVGPHGHVIATEIDKQLVRDLGKRIVLEHLANVEVVQAPPNDVGIAPGKADRILLVNVWHHLADRKRYAARIARALVPGGKVVVVDFKPGGRHGAGHGIAPERVLDELAAGGIDGALVPEDLPDQYVVVGTVRPGVAAP